MGLSELPDLTKGKGNKIISIPSNKILTREEFLKDVLILKPTDQLVIFSGNKKLTLKPQDWKHYLGERGRRGNKLPRAFQKIDAMKTNSG